MSTIETEFMCRPFGRRTVAALLYYYYYSLFLVCNILTIRLWQRSPSFYGRCHEHRIRNGCAMHAAIVVDVVVMLAVALEILPACAIHRR